MDGLVDACKVPCIYKSFDYERYVDQHSLAEHSSRCAHTPCYCYECTSSFEGSPASLMHHLTEPSVDHYKPAAVNTKYETCYPFAVPELRLVSIVCVRGNATNADTKLVYGCVFTVTAPPRYEGAQATSIALTGTMPSCSVPGNVDMEGAWYDFHPKMVHGDSKEVQLVICVTKSNVHH
ncbi:uncharacterized protein [Aegilops tauschii subsp. strangulata]|uniref:uncharacterized protein n=1 Tax=Aegilops tauschii subsp. strangulata TaxID=200361 RepID=UPI00098A9126|nr:uncharacterized protein LOC109739055 [Aegilops tauschii subsp. strangulata]